MTSGKVKDMWNLIAVDKNVALHVDSDTTLGEWITNTTSEQLLSLLKRKKWATFRTSLPAIREAKRRNLNSCLIAMPQELIDMVLKELVDGSKRKKRHSIRCLVLTCAYFFRLLAPNIQSELRKDDTVSWDDDRLVLLQESNERCPTSFRTGQNHVKWNALETGWYGWAGKTVCASILSHNFPDWLYQRMKGTTLGRILAPLRPKLRFSISDSARVEWMTKMLMHPRAAHTMETTDVLRNLTRKTFIRADTLANANHGFTLDMIVLVCIRWPHTVRKIDLGASIWAGHRFDIGTLADVKGRTWRDVSDWAIGELTLVMEGENICLTNERQEID